MQFKGSPQTDNILAFRPEAFFKQGVNINCSTIGASFVNCGIGAMLGYTSFGEINQVFLTDL